MEWAAEIITWMRALPRGTVGKPMAQVSLFRMSIFRHFRVVLYAVSLVSSGYPVTPEHGAEWGHFPFGPACQPLGQVLMPILPKAQAHDASNIPSSPTHSHLLGAVAAFGWQLIPFSPLHLHV